MSGYTYETHIIKNSLLPFIFHSNTVAGQDDFFNWHKNMEILCIINGTGYVKYNSALYSVEKGDIFVVNSDCVHSTVNGHDFRYHCLIVDQSFCSSNGIPSLSCVPLIRDPQLFESFLQIAQWIDSPQSPIWKTAQIRHGILGLLIRLCQDYATPDGALAGKSLSEERVKQAMTYIRSNLSKPLTLEEIAHVVGISKYHFSREFKSLTGETVIDSVNILRCQAAKQLIESGMTVSEAATTCGFENLSYFSKTFKKHLGMLPSSCLIPTEPSQKW